MREGRSTAVSIVLTAGDDGPDGAVTVSTTLQLDLDDPRWPQWIADAVANQAREGASRLRDELLAQTPPPRRLGFVPLAALVDCTPR